MTSLFPEDFGQPQGFFEGRPILWSISFVTTYAYGHLPVEGLGGGQVRSGSGEFLGELQSKLTLPAPCATGYEDDFFLIHISFATEITENTENFRTKRLKLPAEFNNILYLILLISILLCELCVLCG